MDVLANRLRYLRKKRGLTQEELANAVGIARNSIFGYENNRREPTSDILSVLAAVLETTADYLLGLSDVPESNCKVPDGYIVLSVDEFKEMHEKLLNEIMTASLNMYMTVMDKFCDELNVCLGKEDNEI